MASLKGQNLRLLLGGKCVAASTNCSFHIAATIESTTTKDSPEGWEENECTGKSWDASVDALVINGDEEGTYTCSAQTTISSTTYYYDPTAVELKSGDTITITCPTGEYGFAILNSGHTAVLAKSSTGAAKLEYTATADATVLLGTVSYEQAEPCHYAITHSTGIALEAIQEYIADATELDVTFAYTTGTDHRTEDTILCSGKGIINDLSISAQNRQNSTYTVNITGVGELTFGE